jgi:hypothetical protein
VANAGGLRRVMSPSLFPSETFPNAWRG